MSEHLNIPFFSVVIPTYNRADYIGTAIESVLNQEFKHWELIIIDDGSGDNTKDVVCSFNDDRIRYHYQQNQELNAARNKGVHLSRGVFITFLDDDDYYLKSYLKHLNSLIEEHQSILGIYRTGVIIKSSESEIKCAFFNPEIHKNSTNFFLREHSNLLGAAIHRKVFEKFKFNEQFKLFEDIHFLARVSLEFPLFQYLSHDAVYIRHPETRISKYYIQKDKIENCIQCIDDLFMQHGNDIKSLAGKKIYYTIVSSNYLMFSEKFLRQKQLGNSIKYWWLSICFTRTVADFKSGFIHLIRIIVGLFK